MVYALGLCLGSPSFKPSFPQSGKFFIFATAFNLLGLSNAHTKCKETLLAGTNGPPEKFAVLRHAAACFKPLVGVT